MNIRGETWEPTLDDPEIQEYILAEVEEDGMAMAMYIAEHEPISGVEILEAHEDQKGSAVRKVLYRLMEAHVAEYEKDTDAKGWETFVWRLTLNEIKYTLVRRWRDELQYINKQLQFERDHEFYAGKSGARRMMFEDAMEVGFMCPVTGEPMEPVDNSEIVEQLEARKAVLEAGLE